MAVEFAFQDESRFGTITSLGRAWKTRGRDFEVKTKIGRESLYLFGMVTPEDGRLFTQDYDKSNTEAMNDFLRKFSDSRPSKFVIVFLDRAGWHTSGKLEVPANLALVFLPPVSPQLNPIERLWKKIKTDFFHNRIHNGIEDVKNSIREALASLSTATIASLCACSYLKNC